MDRTYGENQQFVFRTEYFFGKMVWFLLDTAGKLCYVWLQEIYHKYIIDAGRNFGQNGKTR